MTKDRTTVTVDERLLRRAKELDLNVSQELENALRKRIEDAQFHLINTNRSNLPNETDDTAIHKHGVAVTFGPREFGEKLDKIETGDWVVSYVNEQGARAAGRAIAEWSGRAVEPENRVILPPDSSISEYHLPVYWVGVLNERTAVAPSELEDIAGRPVWGGGTHVRLSRSDNPELIVDAILGRAFRQR